MSYMARAAAVIAVIYVLVFGTVLTVYHTVLIDDGEYLYQGYRIFWGDKPYRDLFIPQGPVILYSFGFAQKMFGPGLYAGRFTSFALTLGLFALCARTAQRRSGREAGVLAMVMFASHLHALNGYTMIKTHALTALVITAMASCLLASVKRPAWMFGSTFFAGLAVASRITSALLAPPLFIYLLLYHRHRKWYIAGGIASYILGASILFLPSAGPGLLENLGYTLFWVQFLRGSDPAAAGGFFNRIYLLTEAVNAFYPLILLGILLSVAAFRLRRFHDLQAEITLAAQALSVSLLYLVPSQITWLAYQLDVFPLYLLVLSIGASRLIKRMELASSRADLFHTILVGALLFPWTQFRPLVLAPVLDARSKHELPLDHLYHTARLLQPRLAPEDRLLAFEAYLPVILDRKLLPNLGSMMCYVPQWPTERCERFAVVNDAMLQQMISARSAKLILLTDADFAMLAEHQSYSHVMHLSPEQRAGLPLVDEQFVLANGYRLIARVPRYGQSRTELRVYELGFTEE